MVDYSTHGTPKMMEQVDADEDQNGMDLTAGSDSAERVKQVVIASVLAALSIAVAPIASFVPRIPGWGIALFDPVSIFWVVAFLMGGYWVGIMSAFAGTFGLFLYDPDRYVARCSGVLLEMLARGVPVIVPDKCWLADQLRLAGGHRSIGFIYQDRSEIPDLMRQFAKRRGEIKQRSVKYAATIAKPCRT